MREERQREGGRGREGRQGERGQSQPEKPYFKTKEVAGGKGRCVCSGTGQFVMRDWD